MKVLILFLNLLICTLSFSQSETNEEFYQRKIEQFKIELDLMSEIQKDYELTIDSLYNLSIEDSASIVTYQLMVDYYSLKSENMRNEMKQMIVIISSLVSVKKEDE